MLVVDRITELNAIEDPALRALDALRAVEEGRELQKEAAQVRGLAIYAMYAQHGAAKAARLLKMSRPALYRMIAQYAPEEVKQARLETAVKITAAAFKAIEAQQARQNARLAIEVAQRGDEDRPASEAE
jgi:hypothetical protein